MDWHHEDLVLYIILIVPLCIAAGILIVGAFADHYRAEALSQKYNKEFEQKEVDKRQH